MVNKIENKSKFLTYLLTLFFLATPLDYILPHFGNATVLFVLGIAISFVAVCLAVVNPNVRVEKDQLYIIFLIIFSVISIWWAEDSSRAFSYTFSFVATAVMYCLLFLFRFSKDEVAMFEKASIIGGIVFIVYVFTQVDLNLVSAGYRLDLSNVGNGDYFSDPNGLAARLVMPTVLMIKRILEKGKKLNKVIYGISLCLIVYVIFLTGSRASVIMLAAVCLIIFLSFGNKRVGTAVFLIFLGLIAIIFIPNLLPEHIYERIFDRESYQAVTTTEGDRIDIWKNILLKVFPDSPFWGHGTGNACVALSPYYGRIKAVHNSWFIVLVDLGLIGFIPWILFVFGKLKQAFEIRKENIYVFAIMVGVFLMASTLDSTQEKYLWNGFLYVHLIMTMYNPTAKILVKNPNDINF